MTAEKGRFAPSPSGRMHMGNVFASMLAWLFTRRNGGSMVLRIEDLDTMRCTDEFANLIRLDLRWLGLDWDEEAPPQHTRFGAYEAAIELLASKGLTFPCRCTRGDARLSSAPHASDGHPIYPGTCRFVSDAQRNEIASKPHSTRLIVPNETITFTDGVYGEYSESLTSECGDFVIRKADGSFAYQLAVVVDDMANGVTRVVRGRDLISSTARQIYLFRLLGGSAPTYCHVPMLLGEGGRKLSKRDTDLDLGFLQSVITPQKLLGILAYRAGIIGAKGELTANELVREADLTKLSKDDIEINVNEIIT